MKDNIEISGDLHDEYLALQEAEQSEPLPLASDEEIQECLSEVWEDLVDTSDEPYTERDAFNDFYTTQYEEFN